MKEYNLSIQEILDNDNIGKYFKSDDEMIWQLQQNDYCDLELVLIEDLDLLYTPYDRIQDCYTLDAILYTKYKEVQYEC